MSNEDLPQSAESASAYLDGDLDATERATASADPEVMSTVESFSRVRAVLRDVEPVADTTRAASLAAALAEFDALRAPAPGTATPAAATVISLHSRRLRVYRAVMGVAAAAIVVVGIAALAPGGEDSKSSSSATEPPSAEALPQLKAAAAPGAPAATAAAVPGADASPRGGSEVTLPAIGTPEELQQFAANAASGQLAASAPAPAAAGTAAPAAVEPTGSDAAFSRLACISSDQTVIGDISYQGTPAFAVRNAAAGTVQALDATDCRVLGEAPAP